METHHRWPASALYDFLLPTRWGKQLNGNLIVFGASPVALLAPHSLGKAVEWKLNCIWC